MQCNKKGGLSQFVQISERATSLTHPVVEVVVEAQDVVLVRGVVLVDVLEQLDLVQALVEEVLVVLDDLHAHVHPRLQVVRLDRLAERRAAQVLRHVVPPRHHRVQLHREVLLLLETGPVQGMGGGSAK